MPARSPEPLPDHSSVCSPGCADLPILAASGLGFSRAGRVVFSGIDLALGPGDLLQVLGANGSGKTSLLRVLSGLVAPDEGELHWRGRPVRAGNPSLLQALAYVGHANGIDPELSPVENLRFAARLAGVAATPDNVQAALAAFGLERVMHAPARSLSQGLRRRAALARLALARRELWLLDEPVTSLDADAAARFQAQLDDHLRAGGMAIVATHALLPGARTLRLDARS